MRIKVFFISGIIGIAVIAGALQALATPRKRELKEDEKEEGKNESLKLANNRG